jgi:uncharacterized protein
MNAYHPLMLNLPALHIMLLPLITSLYAAGLGIFFVLLSTNTLRLRRKLGIGLGDAGHPQLLRAIRVHANFAEYVPLCLFLMFLVEVQAAPARLLHAMGTTLVTARLAHAYGLNQMPEKIAYRVLGVSLTLINVLSACCYLIVNHLK